MMKGSKVLGAIALTMFLALPAAAVGTVTINFDDLPNGDLPVGALSSYGINSITSSGGSVPAHVYDANDCPSCGYVPPAGSHKFLVTAGGAYPGPTGYFYTTLIFDYATPFFSFYKLGYSVPSVGVAGWSATAYNAADSVVDSVGVNLFGGLDYPPSPTAVPYTLSGSGITKVVFTSNYNYQSTTGAVQVGDFQFGVPEPGTLPTFVFAGIALAIGVLRKRQAASAPGR